ncbi:Uncharacterized protein APZ42_001891 [Daphnia magna]|uniref:Uncharacterized protein n=1 Tax=Daphnia magna TaxID=35525 RepID=A0A164INI7_9CRUS|nr:Uncharacterized protein APZ42_001891 [Daphnia magna]
MFAVKQNFAADLRVNPPLHMHAVSCTS